VTDQANQQANQQQGDQQQGDQQQGDQQQGDQQQGDSGGEGKIGLDRSDEEQSFVDQSKMDFDPDDGLYSGTAVDGSSEIPGPHQDSESGEVNLDEARQEADEAGVDPEDTPAAKSPVAKAAEAERENNENNKGGSDDESD
jgi:hypothetical protein